MTNKEKELVQEAAERILLGVNHYSCIALVDVRKYDPNLKSRYALFYENQFSLWWYGTAGDVVGPQLVEARVLALLLFAEAGDDL